MAAAQDDRMFVDLLLARGADSMQLNEAGMTPLTCARLHQPPAVSVFEPLVKAGGAGQLATAGLDLPPLLHAVTYMQLPAARELLRLGAPVNQRSALVKWTALFLACHHAVQKSAAASPEMRAPATRATESDVLKMVQLLLKSGANPDIASTIGGAGEVAITRVTPLWAATSSRYQRVVKALLAAGATADKEDGICLLKAIYNGQADILRMLLASPGVDVNAQHDAGDLERCYLLHVACMHLDAACVHALLKAGADVSVTDTAGRTALQLLKQPGMPLCVQPIPSAAAVAKTKQGPVQLLIAASKDCSRQAAVTAGAAAASTAKDLSKLASSTAASTAAVAETGAGVQRVRDMHRGMDPGASSSSPAVKACSHCGVLEGSEQAGSGSGSGSGMQELTLRELQSRGEAALAVKLRRCMRCHCVVYCSEACQHAAWKAGHKHECWVAPLLP